jgi:glucoamylase
MRPTKALLCGVCLALLVSGAMALKAAPVWAAAAPNPPSTNHVWTTARKVGIGTSAGTDSKVWFSLANGIVTEVYWPQIDMAQVTDLQLLVTDGQTFFHEEKQDARHTVEYLHDKSLGYRLINTDPGNRYVITKEIVTDPERDSLLMHVTFDAKVDGLRLYVLLNPAVSNTGLYDYAEAASDALYAWDDRIKFASGNPAVGQVQALISSIPYKKVSAGFVGDSDGWQDLRADKKMDWTFETASNGNVALTAQLDVPATVGVTTFELILGFGHDKAGAKAVAQASLGRGFTAIKTDYIAGWNTYCSSLADLSAVSHDGGKLYYTSAMVLKAHEDKTFPGGMIASLTVPWGTSQNDNDSGDERGIIPDSGPDGYKDGPVGYHVVWPRDLYQVATAFLAAGDTATAKSALEYLKSIQFRARDGTWDFCATSFPKAGSFPQNCWLSGIPHWGGLQMDETAMPIILAWRLWKAGEINPADYYASFIKPAAEFISHYGPWTQQERWEENMGLSPSTAAAEIAAMVTAADFARAVNDPDAAAWYLQQANDWLNNVEAWSFTTTGPYGDHQYFERLDGTACGASWNPNDSAEIVIGNCGGKHREKAVLDGGFLELVRFGLKRPSEQAITETIEEYDQIIRRQTPKGPGYYRYNYDGYGEKADGGDYDGCGKGRLWPLLTGERGHYELALAGGDPAAADLYIETMENFANAGRMLAEQVWDVDSGTYQKGEGTGSATPLAWSHAEYIRLLRSKQEQKIMDTPAVVKQWAECVTTFRIHHDAGWGNYVAIRGNQAPLSWKQGKAAHWTAGNVWSYTTRGLAGSFEFKTLLNDQQWETLSGNHTGQACQVNEITPNF